MVRDGTTGRGWRAAVWMLLLAASLLLVYPSLGDAGASIRQVSELNGYAAAAASMTKEDVEREIAAARAYNAKIAEEQRREPFSYRGGDASDAEYRANLASCGGIMGYLEIPKIRLNLPIAHGTRPEELEYECGHLYGTSLPVGGASSHSVIAGHTGLPTAELFTHLTELAEGEQFFIHILGAVHAYEIREIRVVLPEEESRYLQVADGRDLITLYTCTPYGINDRRLLVTGERTTMDAEMDATTDQSILMETISRRAVLRFVLLAAVPMTVAGAGLLRVLGAPGRRERKRKPRFYAPRQRGGQMKAKEKEG